MYINGQKLHLLQGRTGVAAEPVGVEDEGLKKKNQDGGAGQDREHGHDDTMEDDEDENEILEEEDDG